MKKSSRKTNPIYLGDTVKVVKSPRGYSGYTPPPEQIGKTGRVLAISHSEAILEYPDGKQCELFRRNLSLVKKSTTRYPHKGDVVQVMKGHLLGTVGTIVGTDHFFWEVKTDTDKVALPMALPMLGDHLEVDHLEVIKSYDGSPVPETLLIDPRTFYKILIIDGTPPNEDAAQTNFRYTLPTRNSRWGTDLINSWTPIIPADKLSLCQCGYHILPSPQSLLSWIGNYSHDDIIVTKCRARGMIIGGSDDTSKLVAQSIIITDILYRWRDVELCFESAVSELRAKCEKEVTALKSSFVVSPAAEWLAKK